MFGLGNSESSIEIDINQIRSFKDHSFKVLDDEKMAELVQSIQANGVLMPVVVRGNDDDGYEMISGHRRLHASVLPDHINLYVCSRFAGQMRGIWYCFHILQVMEVS